MKVTVDASNRQLREHIRSMTELSPAQQEVQYRMVKSLREGLDYLKRNGVPWIWTGVKVVPVFNIFMVVIHDPVMAERGGPVKMELIGNYSGLIHNLAILANQHYGAEIKFSDSAVVESMADKIDNPENN